ncbi:hypothetical protein K3181_01340 [Qipengyuania sp. YG27]|uniref:DUF4148 domain-containing protein n=1 Tax=Qipengyuania mesophila TaxID=2867246 RepID=A0ABS7JR35_9SPHN|nr:hypothetical protein [Qipengyuania mesophila]MBX7500084.1 hypothetical protein [Qipengyuania mesophila]
MNARLLAGAIALGSIALSTPVLADDPNDPSMRSRQARERDAAIIRQLNLEQLRYVQKRDAEQAKGWQATRDYPNQLAEHEKRMAAWRHAVRMCESGHYEYCAR